MDKYEYRVKTEQMLDHLEKKEYQQAKEIADGIDWRRVKNASMLNTVSEIYEYNGEFKKGRDILFLAFDRAPGSRKIVYRLGTLALKIKDIREATDCYEEFVKLAPKDPNQYILKYKILRTQGASLTDQITALEEFKKAEYIEKWAYELAKLYDEAGMTAECLEECDDLILWFSEGKYVMNDEEWKLLTDGLNKLGQIAKDKGMMLTFHHHMGTVIQTEEEIDRFMNEVDKDLVYLLFDSGHCSFAGIDPVKVLSKYIDRTRHIHLKDLRSDVVAQSKKEGWSFLKGVREGTFTVPGDGDVDFAPIFDIIEKSGYEGYVVVEAEQDPAKANPLEYAMKARKYIAEKTGL